MVMTGDTFGCHSWDGVILASSGVESRVLLNILECTEPPLPTQNYLVKMPILLLLKNPGLAALAERDRNPSPTCFSKRRRRKTKAG